MKRSGVWSRRSGIWLRRREGVIVDENEMGKWKRRDLRRDINV